MDNKTAGIVSYLTWIGTIVAYFARSEKSEYTAFHIRQMVGLILCQFAISIIGGILTATIGSAGMVAYVLLIGLFVLWIIGFLGALKEEQKEVPVLGAHFQKWFAGIK